RSRCSSAAPGLAQGAGEERLGVVALEALEQLLGLERLVAEVDEAVAGKRAGVAFLGGGDHAGGRFERSRDLLAELDDDPFGRSFADPGHGLEAFRVARGD